jgi:threonyl-tRNA synthetase
MAEKFQMDYFIGIGEAAMYGPKMDFMAVDALGREWQLATVQLDYAMPTRFGLEYTAEDGSKKTPVMTIFLSNAIITGVSPLYPLIPSEAGLE